MRLESRSCRNTSGVLALEIRRTGAVGSEWIRVTRSHPCPICEGTTWCTVSGDGAVVHCMRAQSDKSLESGGWIHKVGGAKVIDFIRAEKKCEQRPLIRWSEEAHRMYTASKASSTRVALARELGVTVESLELLNVGWGADRDEFASFPMRDMRQRICGIVRRYSDGAKKTMKWSRNGLFHAEKYLDFGGPILVAEGGSDVAALLSMGLCGVGRPSNTGGVPALISLLTRPEAQKRTVWILAERDEKPDRRGKRDWCPASCTGCGLCFPGLHGAKEVAAQLTKALEKNVRYRFPPDEAKDVRAWMNEHGCDGRRFLAGLRASPARPH